MTDHTCVLLHAANPEPMAADLRAKVPDVDVQTCSDYASLPGLINAFAPDVVYTVRFAGTPGFPRDALFAKNGPRWIANGGAGTDHFGVWDPDRVTVTNAAGVAADMMAEYVMGCFLHFTLDVPGLQRDKARRAWTDRLVKPLKGKTLLVVGLGHTGRAIAARASAFGMTVLGTRARPRPMKDVDEVQSASSLINLLPRADFVAVATPLTSETQGLLGHASFSAMKNGTILADVSRGGVIVQDALVAALESGHVAAAALDVFETEPLPTTSPLWEFDNLIISPHCSSVYDGWDQASFDLFLNNLSNWLTGAPLFNVVEPTRGY
ncbi:MAG: D-2-hydroxyacid dehydrogenase [Pseudomonadota bacterium]